MRFNIKSFLPTSVYISTVLLCVAAITLRPHQSFAGCGNDNDCKGDRICVNDICVDPALNKAAVQPSTTVEPATVPSGPSQNPANTSISTADTLNADAPIILPTSASVVYEESGYEPEKQSEEETDTFPPLGLWDIWFNPMGFIQFGPTAGFEIRTATNLYVGIHGRYAAMGMLYNSLLESRADDENYDSPDIEVSPRSAAVGAEFKYYMPFPHHANMLYFGMFGEYMWGGYSAFQSSSNYSSTSILDPKMLYEAKHQSIGMGAMVGHRWRLGEARKVLLTAGIITGVARPFLSTKNYVSPKKTVNMPQSNEFIFMAEIALGYGM